MIADKLWESTVKAALRGKITADLTKCSAREDLVDADIEWLDSADAPFTIPANWEWVKFSELVNFQIGKTPKRQDSMFWSPEDTPWVSISDMSREGTRITKTKESVSPLAFKDVFHGRLVPKGTLLMSFKLSIGKCAFLDIDAVHNEAIISVFPRLDDATSVSQFLSYALPVMALLGKSKNAIKGATLNKNSISNILIPFPPLDEQKAIVKRLEVLKEQIDHLAELEREREYLDKQFVAVLEQVVPVDILNVAPASPIEGLEEEQSEQHLERELSKRMQRLRQASPYTKTNWKGTPWPLKSLGSLCVHITSGSTPKGGRAVYTDQGIAFLRSQNVHNDGLRLNGVAHIPLRIHQEKPNSQVLPGDLLLNITGASIGRAAVVPDNFAPANINQHILILRLQDTADNEYVHQVLIARNTFLDIMALQNGSTKEGLSGEKAAALAIPFPDKQTRAKKLGTLKRVRQHLYQLMELVSS